MTGERQEAALRQYARPRLVLEVDAAKLRATHARNPVVASQPFVQERVPPREKFIDTAVRTNDRSEEQFRLLPQVEPHLVVESGELRRIGFHVCRRQPSQPE